MDRLKEAAEALKAREGPSVPVSRIVGELVMEHLPKSRKELAEEPGVAGRHPSRGRGRDEAAA